MPYFLSWRIRAWRWGYPCMLTKASRRTREDKKRWKKRGKESRREESPSPSVVTSSLLAGIAGLVPLSTGTRPELPCQVECDLPRVSLLAGHAIQCPALLGQVGLNRRAPVALILAEYFCRTKCRSKESDFHEPKRDRRYTTEKGDAQGKITTSTACTHCSKLTCR